MGDAADVRVLLAGESWVSHTIHVKGFDSFTTSEYAEGASWLITALESGGAAVDFLPNHEAARKFPASIEALRKYRVVILSDIGSNTLLLHPDTFSKSMRVADRCELIAEYVRQGGGLIMIGGYMSFSGIDGKARYGRTALREVLPVTMVEGDDRVERPEGVTPEIVEPEHSIFAGIGPDWPRFLGYNQLLPREGGRVLARIGEDVFLAVGTYGQGKCAAFASDCGPHWGPPEFVGWEHYARFWQNLVKWLAA
ncbi:MAG: glutamine amidotransferase [Meiothermus silvanus]|nr:glutamine amidotransferase [Allomeiothermus silvanus]